MSHDLIHTTFYLRKLQLTLAMLMLHKFTSMHSLCITTKQVIYISSLAVFIRQTGCFLFEYQCPNDGD